ncbi:MAG: tyrosine-type recombinase/integrase [Bacteroidia bacterium]|nr:tyrosine-type recombinase/integrase [Bacteroidia bacterium]
MKPAKKIFVLTPVKIYSGGKNQDLSKQWFVYFTDSLGKRRRVYGNLSQYQTVPERLAAARLLKREVEENLEFLGLPVLIQFLHKFLEYKKKTVRKRTYESYLSKSRVFIDYYDGGDFERVQAELFLDYLIYEKGLSTGTRNDFRVFLSMFFGHLVERQQWPSNPFEFTKKLKESRQPARYFRPNQVKHLMRVFREERPTLTLFVEMMFYTFIRPAELRKLRISAIDWEEKRIWIDGSFSKNKKTQAVKIPIALENSLEIFQELPLNWYLFGRVGGTPGPDPVGINYFTKQHLQILRKLGYPPEYKLYSWKHTGAAMAIKAGINIKELQLQLRHHSLDQVDQYLRQLGVQDLENLANLFPKI